MKQPKHTPGPWYTNERFVESEMETVAEVKINHVGWVYNAALIAAAPEMLRLLDECDSAFATIMIGRDHGLTPQAEAAIRELAPQVQAVLAKAKGE